MLQRITLKSRVISPLCLLPLLPSHLPAVFLYPSNNKRLQLAPPPHRQDIQVNFVEWEMNSV